VTFPVITSDLTVLIDQAVDDLDSYSDLEEKGCHAFVEATPPEIKDGEHH
jgi:hypothetical protein